MLNTILGRTSNSNAIDWLGNPRLNLWAVLVEATWRQAGYVMVLYLAGLKAVDNSLREAADIDGANQWQTFWRVVFPVMKPINIVVLVVTIIESLRAYDLVYITSKGAVLPGLELLSMLITQSIIGQTQRIGYGSALATVLLVIALVPICIFLFHTFRREGRRR
jgi:ABC-type sugar transport system permease subunit